MIRDGLHGDAVLIPEPLCDVLPIAGRGSATWKVTIGRQGPPVHEVMRPRDEPSVIAAGAELIARLNDLDRELAATLHPVCGAASVFVGQFHAGEIYNQYPQSAWLEGTRRGCRVLSLPALSASSAPGSPGSRPTCGRRLTAIGF